jgi:hypothetical protein
LQNMQIQTSATGRPLKVAAAVQRAEELGRQLLSRLKTEESAIATAAEAVVQASKGGRPLKREDLLVDQLENLQCVMSAGSVNRSNRRIAGMQRQRREENAATKFQMCKDLQKMKMSAASMKEFAIVAGVKYGMPWKRLKLILQKQQVWQKLVEDRKLGKGFSGSSAANGVRTHQCKRARKFGVGMRAPGGGRKDRFWHVKLRVKRWLAQERSRCHFVDKQDLLNEFMEQCEEEASAADKVLQTRTAMTDADPSSPVNKLVQLPVELGYLAQETVPAPGYEDLKEVCWVESMETEDLQKWIEELRDRVSKLSLSEKYSETYSTTLAAQIEAKLLKPSRMSKLSMEEEEARVKATWQQFDHLLWVAAFGNEDVLRKYVADPAHWMQNREKVVVGMSDQIPVWVKVGRTKQLYCAEELKAANQNMKKQQQVQLPALQAGGLKTAEGTEGSTLTRTTGDATAEKFRITYEARQVVMNYFSSEDPVGIVWTGALVLKASVHARLDNISNLGTWIVDEEFEYAGHTIKRFAGKSAGRILHNFRKVRDESPGLLQHLEVYCQPAAVVDSIIQKWMLEKQAAAFPCSLWVRDMLASSVADQSMVAMALCQQIGSFIGGGCTPLLQVTDTDFSFSFKCSIAEAQKMERRKQTAIAKLKGEAATFSCGAREIVEILHVAHEKQLQRQSERPWILRACRNNGFFHWRPSFSLGKLVEASSQSWCEGLVEGSYRLVPRWVQERGCFVDEHGVPMKPQFSMYGEAKQLAAEAEADYCRKEGYLHTVKGLTNVKLIEHHAAIEADEIATDVQEQVSSLLEMLPAKVQRKLKQLRINSKFVEAISDKGLEQNDHCSDAKEDNPVKAKPMRRVLLKKGQARLKEMLKTMSRQEALMSLKMKAGISKKKKLKKHIKSKPSLKCKPSLKLKPCAKTKPSLKLKPSLKSKPSVLKKMKKKKSKSSFAAKIKKSKLKQSLLDAAIDAECGDHCKKVADKNTKQHAALADGKPSVTDGPEALAAEKTETVELPHLKPGKEVLCCSELAGQFIYGKVGVLVKAVGENASVDFSPAAGVVTVQLQHLCKANGTNLVDFKAKKTMQGINLVTKDLKLAWLQQIEDLYLEPPNVQGQWLLDWHMSAAMKYLQWALWLEKTPSNRTWSYVDPLLSSAWFVCTYEAAVRREMLKDLFCKDCILCPIARQAAANHWSLLVVVKDLKLVQYFDSLPKASEKNKEVAEAVLHEFCPELKFPISRSNSALQPAGSSTCGCFVLHWMEQACRTHLLNESPCSAGWPQPKVWAGRVVKIAAALIQMKANSEADAEKAKMKELKKLEVQQKKDALAKKGAAAGALAESLKGPAEFALKKVPASKPCRENLSSAAQAAILEVEAKGMKVCSKCKFQYGCFMCHPDKALQYWLKKEFGHMM